MKNIKKLLYICSLLLIVNLYGKQEVLPSNIHDERDLIASPLRIRLSIINNERKDSLVEAIEEAEEEGNFIDECNFRFELADLLASGAIGNRGRTELSEALNIYLGVNSSPQVDNYPIIRERLSVDIVPRIRDIIRELNNMDENS